MQYVLSILPLLACSLMMGVMMWVMMRGNQGNQGNQGKSLNPIDQAPMPSLTTSRDSGNIAASAPSAYRPPEERIGELQARLQAQQQAIAGQIAALADEPEGSKSVRG